MNKIVNLSLFIVPNSGCSLKYVIGYQQDLKLLHQIGINASPETTCLQVWIHCPEHNLDNCTDHGYDKEIINALGIEAEECYNQRAPGFFPMDILTGVREGEVREYMAPNGIKVRIKFEQLPYRYGRFGTIDTVAKSLVFRTKENNSWHEEMGHNQLAKHTA